MPPAVWSVCASVARVRARVHLPPDEADLACSAVEVGRCEQFPHCLHVCATAVCLFVAPQPCRRQVPAWLPSALLSPSRSSHLSLRAPRRLRRRPQTASQSHQVGVQAGLIARQAALGVSHSHSSQRMLFVCACTLENALCGRSTSGMQHTRTADWDTCCALPCSVWPVLALLSVCLQPAAWCLVRLTT
jgi:hypothetical protein